MRAGKAQLRRRARSTPASPAAADGDGARLLDRRIQRIRPGHVPVARRHSPRARVERPARGADCEPHRAVLTQPREPRHGTLGARGCARACAPRAAARSLCSSGSIGEYTRALKDALARPSGPEADAWLARSPRARIRPGRDPNAPARPRSRSSCQPALAQRPVERLQLLFGDPQREHLPALEAELTRRVRDGISDPPIRRPAGRSPSARHPLPSAP